MYNISKDELQTLINFLQGCPYNQVFQLINMIQNLPQCPIPMKEKEIDMTAQ